MDLFLSFSLSSLWETSQTLFWAIFGLIDLDNFELTGIKEFTRFSGLLMFGSFSVINIIVLLNLLIAMMNHSYQLISVSSVSNVISFDLIFIVHDIDILYSRKRLMWNGNLLEANFGSHILRKVGQFRLRLTSFLRRKAFITSLNGSLLKSAEGQIG